ncbi:MAG: lipocalin family protein [Sulfurospirillum sp.]|nr:lipocalin family protein [Sulfurospirillum sp.]
MRLIIFSVFISFLLLGCSTKPSTLQSVAKVDIEKYSGDWYEIARYENRFEKDCIGARANYTPKGSSIEVINTCFNAEGKKIAQAKGSAYATQDSHNAKLRVSFFWPFYGNYWIILLPSDYRYAVISEPKKEYLWILAREKTLLSSDKKEILDFLHVNGYDAQKLFWTQLDKLP